MRTRNLIQQSYRYRVHGNADSARYAKIFRALIDSEVRLAGFDEESSADGELVITIIGERWQLDHFWQCLSHS